MQPDSGACEASPEGENQYARVLPAECCRHYSLLLYEAVTRTLGLVTIDYLQMPMSRGRNWIFPSVLYLERHQSEKTVHRHTKSLYHLVQLQIIQGVKAVNYAEAQACPISGHCLAWAQALLTMLSLTCFFCCQPCTSLGTSGQEWG